MRNTPATPDDLREIFGNGFSEEYRAEAEQRWANTDAWKQSQARAKRYTRADWLDIKAETETINADFVAALESGEPADSVRVMDVAERARGAIDSRFYDCPPAFHRHLGGLYVADPRFTKTHEDLAPGLAAHVRAAIHANADRQEG